jgi:hypothetical protein
MALPNTGGGYQFGSGNLDEINFQNGPAPTTATDTATLTVAQVLNGLILATPTSAAAYTLPLATDMDATLVNAKTGTFFDFRVINLASSNYDITMTTNTGWTLTGGGVAVVQELSSATFRVRKTGTATYSLYRIS